jgi:hypothetical protein
MLRARFFALKKPTLGEEGVVPENAGQMSLRAAFMTFGPVHRECDNPVKAARFRV